MKKIDFLHEAKSRYAYNIDLHTLHIRFRSKKGVCDFVSLIYGDPFCWVFNDSTQEYLWEATSQVVLPLQKEFSTEDSDMWFVEVKSETKRIKYAFLIDNQWLFCSTSLINLASNPQEKYNLFNYFNFPYLLNADTYHAPSWVKNTIWYSIFPDRFCNQSNPRTDLFPWNDSQKVQNYQFYGGNLLGIISKLDYISQLGFGGIYLTPIFKAPSAHKYDTVDYFQIDPSFGTNEDLKELVKQAHQRGIKVMLDAVFNHVSYLHPFFQDVIKNEEKSPYYNSFYIKKLPVLPFDIQELNMGSNKRQVMHDLNYETFAFTPRMPKINTEDPIMRQHLLDCTSYWMKECNIDGWRLDVANEVSHDFWREFRKVVKSINPNCFILGENWDSATPWLQGDQHDAVMNYSFMFPIWSYFSNGFDSPFIDHLSFRDAISEVLFQTPKNVILQMFNLVDSHDTKRVSSVMNENAELLKLVYLFQFSLPGSPSVYYGGEIGLPGQKDPDNRRCMIWNQETPLSTLKDFFFHLTTKYQTIPAFTSVHFKWIYTSNDCLIYQKDNVYFLLNKSSDTLPISAYVPPTHSYNLWTDKEANLINGLLEPMSFMILSTKD